MKDVPAIDGSKVAAAGASYGGYLAAWLLGHTDRFRCLVDHAGVNDFITEYGSDSTSYGFDALGLGRHALEGRRGDAASNNPMTYAADFKTPMLIIAGEHGLPRARTATASSLYGVLQAMSVPSRLLIFPNENHWVLSPAEFDLLELRGAAVAGPLHRRQAHGEAGLSGRGEMTAHEHRQARSEGSRSRRERRLAALRQPALLARAAVLEKAVDKAFGELGARITRGHAYDPEKKHGFIDGQARGIQIFRKIDPDAPLVVAEAVWQYTSHVLAGLTSTAGRS